MGKKITMAVSRWLLLSSKYSISHRMCIWWFLVGLYCLWWFGFVSHISPNILALFHRHWDIHMTALGLVKLPWRIWVEATATKVQQNIKRSLNHCVLVAWHRSGSNLAQVLTCWLRHQAWISVDLSWTKAIDMNLRAIQLETHQPPIKNSALKYLSKTSFKSPRIYWVNSRCDSWERLSYQTICIN